MSKLKQERARRSFAPAKQPFKVTQALSAIRRAVRDYPKAALFDLADEGHGSLFEVLVACILSIRTRDEVTVLTARRLFAAARTPAEMARLSVERINGLIRTCSFHEAKARQIREIARQSVAMYRGKLPCDRDALESLHGVGPKCAGLALGIACRQSHIAVDVHVHRVVNRWGWIAAATPEKTMTALLDKLPKRYWVELNALLVPFGKHVCTRARPKCSACPVVSMCAQVGVTMHR